MGGFRALCLPQNILKSCHTGYVSLTQISNVSGYLNVNVHGANKLYRASRHIHVRISFHTCTRNAIIVNNLLSLWQCLLI